MNAKLKGVFVPLATPFDEGQELDLKAYRANIEKLNQTGVAGYMPLGSNGEFSHMSDEEQLAVLKMISTEASPEKVRMVGAARQSAYATVEFMKRAFEYGADFFSVLCPSYYADNMNDDALFAYYTWIADNSPAPVLLYNCPKFAAGVSISPALVARLAKHPNIAGMKDTSRGNIESFLKASEGSEFEVVAGSIENMVPGLPIGSSGGVISMSNYLPSQCCEIYELFVSGQTDKFNELSAGLIALNRGASGKYGVPGVKAAMNILGYNAGRPRLPLLQLSGEQKIEIEKSFAAAGFTA